MSPTEKLMNATVKNGKFWGETIRTAVAIIAILGGLWAFVDQRFDLLEQFQAATEANRYTSSDHAAHMAMEAERAANFDGEIRHLIKRTSAMPPKDYRDLVEQRFKNIEQGLRP